MKKLILMALLFTGQLFTNRARAQETTDRYVVIRVETMKPPFKKNDVHLTGIDYGQDDNSVSFKDSLVVRQLKKVNDMKSEAAILNYMLSLHWYLANFATGNSVSIFIFKRSFDKNEILTLPGAGN